jgi:hypothetical protein
MQYSIQGLNCDDPERKDLLMDVGTEELSHLEVVGTLARLHLKPMKAERDAAEVDPLIAIAGGVYLDDLSRRLLHQYLPTFLPKSVKKAGMQSVKLRTEVSDDELVSADEVYVPASE